MGETEPLKQLGMSLPSRERGLKCIEAKQTCMRTVVAPFAGAWIEMISFLPFPHLPQGVAPFAGAWIEMFLWQSKTLGSIRRSLRGSVD